MTQMLQVPSRERIRRDVVLRSLAGTHRLVLTTLRTKLRTLFRQRRKQAIAGRLPWTLVYVTADDARRILARLAQADARFRVTNRNFLGALFRTADWSTDGSTILSTTAGSHANRLLQWRWVGA